MLQQALARSSTTAPCCRQRRDLVTASASQAAPQQPQVAVASRRRALLAGAAAAVAAPPLLLAGPARAAEEAAAAAPAEAAAAPSAAAAPADIRVLEDQPGSGTAAARRGDLVLVHYKGTCGDGALFDSTLGGAMYRDGGIGVLRPAVIRLGGAPVPGVCDGLQRGIEGMAVGGRRTFTVPPSLGFGSGMVLAPYGIVPGGSELRYEVQLLRLSRQGPDALMSGISQCGAGTANERNSGCGDITVAEFV